MNINQKLYKIFLNCGANRHNKNHICILVLTNLKLASERPKYVTDHYARKLFYNFMFMVPCIINLSYNIQSSGVQETVVTATGIGHISR
jgi:hypothetical protein